MSKLAIVFNVYTYYIQDETVKAGQLISRLLSKIEERALDQTYLVSGTYNPMLLIILIVL